MREIINGMNVGVFKKDWGRELYFERAEDACNYLNSKGLYFISKQVQEKMEYVSSYKEICVTENNNGYVLEVGRCGFASHSYFPIFKK
ncbi:hypothetical protein [Halalkalibacter oceani]|uniref:hypothetical protein n=1 Tax=Halalkalibacter oceani TaxID=1653776 RepID=UPI0033946909